MTEEENFQFEKAKALALHEMDTVSKKSASNQPIIPLSNKYNPNALTGSPIADEAKLPLLGPNTHAVEDLGNAGRIADMTAAKIPGVTPLINAGLRVSNVLPSIASEYITAPALSVATGKNLMSGWTDIPKNLVGYGRSSEDIMKQAGYSDKTSKYGGMSLDAISPILTGGLASWASGKLASLSAPYISKGSTSLASLISGLTEGQKKALVNDLPAFIENRNMISQRGIGSGQQPLEDALKKLSMEGEQKTGELGQTLAGQSKQLVTPHNIEVHPDLAPYVDSLAEHPDVAPVKQKMQNILSNSVTTPEGQTMLPGNHAVDMRRALDEIAKFRVAQKGAGIKITGDDMAAKLSADINKKLYSLPEVGPQAQALNAKSSSLNEIQDLADAAYKNPLGTANSPAGTRLSEKLAQEGFPEYQAAQQRYSGASKMARDSEAKGFSNISDAIKTMTLKKPAFNLVKFANSLEQSPQFLADKLKKPILGLSAAGVVRQPVQSAWDRLQSNIGEQ